MSSYVVWANKGGIGKSTMTFQLACATARQNPDKMVLVIDLSPQCDVSRMLLGGGHGGGEGAILSLMQANSRPTILSYLLACLNNVPAGMGWPVPANFIVSPSIVRAPGNQPIPANIQLMCGDFDLERAIQLIEQLPQPPRRSGRAPTGPEYSTYLLIRSFVRAAVNNINATGNYIVFIDTDPYFNVITTHMGLLGASNWVSAYSPTSQASQFAVLRSVEFMFDNASGLNRFVSDEYLRYPNPWYDNRGGALSVPHLSLASPFLLMANMTNPYKRTGGQSYTDAQRLHRQTIAAVTASVQAEIARHTATNFPHHLHMWDMRRLGLICDYNGVDLEALQLGANYPEPGSPRNYHLNVTGGTPNQLAGYKRKLQQLAALF